MYLSSTFRLYSFATFPSPTRRAPAAQIYCRLLPSACRQAPRQRQGLAQRRRTARRVERIEREMPIFFLSGTGRLGARRRAKKYGSVARVQGIIHCARLPQVSEINLKFKLRLFLKTQKSAQICHLFPHDVSCASSTTFYLPSKDGVD